MVSSEIALDPTKVVGRRCAQFVLDMAIVVVPVLVLGIGLGIPLFPTSSLTALKVFAITLVAGMFLLYMVGVLLVYLWWPHTHGGQTPAMRWLGLRIVTVEGTQPPLRAYVIRFLLQVVDGFLWGVVGVVLMLVNDRHQRFGDMIAGTVVVRAN
jgi:uncharacterized RDD family membrane protein YckC